MAKKLMLIVLAGITLLAVTDTTFGGPRGGGRRDGGRWGGGYSRGGRHHGSGVIIIPPRIRPVIVFPPRRIIISPTIVFGSSTTTREIIREETVIVWVTNDNGSKTEVRLTKTNDGGYIGPKGEYYSSMPTEEQLKSVYGLRCAPAGNSVMVWFENNDGMETVVVLTKDGSGYIGPKGERYKTMPTVEQLKSIYSE